MPNVVCVLNYNLLNINHELPKPLNTYAHKSQISKRFHSDIRLCKYIHNYGTMLVSTWKINYIIWVHIKRAQKPHHAYIFWRTLDFTYRTVPRLVRLCKHVKQNKHYKLQYSFRYSRYKCRYYYLAWNKMDRTFGLDFFFLSIYLECRIASRPFGSVVGRQIPANRVQLVDVQQVGSEEFGYDVQRLAPQEQRRVLSVIVIRRCRPKLTARVRLLVVHVLLGHVVEHRYVRIWNQ